MKLGFWRRHINFWKMGGWSFESIPNIWISFASCFIFICQNVCKTSDLLATVKLKLLTPLKSWINMMLQCIDPAWDPVVFVSRFAAMPVRDQISFNLCTKTHSQSYGGLEECGWLYGRSLRPMCFFEMERHALRLASCCSGNLQWRRLGCRRSCHCRAQNLKHMLSLQLSCMPFSSELFFVGCSKFAFSCICTWIHLQRVESCLVEVLEDSGIWAAGYFGSWT